MTKFVLAGGCDRKYPDYWRELSQEVLADFPEPKILSCFFSQESQNRAAKHEQFDKFFTEYFGSKVKIIHADENNFFDQIEYADIVYLHGGKTQLLLDAIPDVSQFVNATENKIVIGSSAGANFLSNICFSPSASRVIKSTGILNLGVVVHYGIDQFEDKMYSREFWNNAVSSVRADLGADLPILLLPEGTFTIFEK
jgi:hypothetical protein